MKRPSKPSALPAKGSSVPEFWPVRRLLRRVSAALLRTAALLQRLAGTPDGQAEPGGPPEHWRRLVAERAPHLLRPEPAASRPAPSIGGLAEPVALPRPPASVRPDIAPQTAKRSTPVGTGKADPVGVRTARLVQAKTAGPAPAETAGPARTETIGPQQTGRPRTPPVRATVAPRLRLMPAPRRVHETSAPETPARQAISTPHAQPIASRRPERDRIEPAPALRKQPDATAAAGIIHLRPTRTDAPTPAGQPIPTERVLTASPQPAPAARPSPEAKLVADIAALPPPELWASLPEPAPPPPPERFLALRLAVLDAEQAR